MDGPTVWAAEHGASTPDLGRGEDASNVGHRWRIHGRLDDLLADEGEPNREAAAPRSSSGASTLDVEGLRRLIARETEIDAHDLHIELLGGGVTLRGTVPDEGARLALLELMRRQPGVVAVHDRLLVLVA